MNKKIILKIFSILIIILGIIWLFFGIYRLGIFRDNSRGLSMYLKDNILYYGGKNGGLYKYDNQSGSSLLVKKADGVFGVEDSDIYYTYKDNYFVFHMDNETTEKTEDFSNKIELLYADSVQNSEEVKGILGRSNGFSDNPFALYENNKLFVSHNAKGGYISVYDTVEAEGKINVVEDSEKILEHSYSMWQGMMNGFISVPSIFLNAVFDLICPILLIILGIVFIRK